MGMGYCWGLSVCCAEAPLPRFMAYSTCVHTLMFFLYILLLQSGKDPRTLWSLRMPLRAQCFTCLLACVSAAASCGQVPPQEQVSSSLPALRYPNPSVAIGANEESNEYTDPENLKSVADRPGEL